MDLFAPSHLALIVIVGLVLFVVVKRLPQVGRSIGRSVRGFRNELTAAADHPTLAPASPAGRRR